MNEEESSFSELTSASIALSKRANEAYCAGGLRTVYLYTDTAVQVSGDRYVNSCPTEALRVWKRGPIRTAADLRWTAAADCPVVDRRGEGTLYAAIRAGRSPFCAEDTAIFRAMLESPFTVGGE